MFINKDILVHHISKYTNIKSTYNLFTTCKDLYKHINEVLNLDNNTRILSIDDTCDISKLNEFEVLEVLNIDLNKNIKDKIDLCYPNINDINIYINTFLLDFNINNITLHHTLESLHIISVDYLSQSIFSSNEFNIPRSIKSLTINNLKLQNHQVQSFFNYLQHNCKQLKYLMIDLINNDEPITIEGFDNLYKLVLYNDSNIVIRDLKNLNKLVIKSPELLTLNKLPSLRTMKLLDFNIIINDDTIKINKLIISTFFHDKEIELNTTFFDTIEHVELTTSNYDRCYNYILKHMKSIKYLTLNILPVSLSRTYNIKEYEELEQLHIKIIHNFGNFNKFNLNINLKGLNKMKDIIIKEYYQYHKTVRNKYNMSYQYPKEYNISEDNKLIHSIITQDMYDIKPSIIHKY